MIEPGQDNDETILVHWTYSIAEWRRFSAWDRRRKGLWRFLGSLFSFGPRSNMPFVVITYREVCAEDKHQVFQCEDRRLATVNIIDTGKLNVLEILFKNNAGRQPVLGNISVPVPKGKLREAIEVQEYLLTRCC